MIKKDIHNFLEANPEVKQRIEDRRLKALENEKKEEYGSADGGVPVDIF